MEILNEAELLNNLRIRYKQDQIFTYVGTTLLAINPFKKVDQLFTEEILQKFQKFTSNPRFLHNMAEPHIYAIAAMSYWQLMATGKKQAIVIGGESGSGKTEETKLSLNFLALLGKSEEIKIA